MIQKYAKLNIYSSDILSLKYQNKNKNKKIRVNRKLAV